MHGRMGVACMAACVDFAWACRWMAEAMAHSLSGTPAARRWWWQRVFGSGPSRFTFWPGVLEMPPPDCRHKVLLGVMFLEIRPKETRTGLLGCAGPAVLGGMFTVGCGSGGGDALGPPDGRMAAAVLMGTMASAYCVPGGGGLLPAWRNAAAGAEPESPVYRLPLVIVRRWQAVGGRLAHE
jgi:hypothetical protein